MKPSPQQLADYFLEHGVNVRTKEDRQIALDELESVLQAEIKGQVTLTRGELARIVNLKCFVSKNLWTVRFVKTPQYG